MCPILIVIGILLYSCNNGFVLSRSVHVIEKRQAQDTYEVITIDTDNIRDLATGLQSLLNTVQQTNGRGQQQFQFQLGTNSQGNQRSGQNFPRGPGPPPGGPPGRPDFGPPPRNQHFGSHPPPPPPPPHQGPPWEFDPPGFGPPGWQWQDYGPPGHHGPHGRPFHPPDFGRPPPPPPPPEGGMHFGHHPHNPPGRGPPHYNNHQNQNNQNAGQGNPANDDEDKKNIVGYLDNGFPIILLEDNEIRR